MNFYYLESVKENVKDKFEPCNFRHVLSDSIRRCFGMSHLVKEDGKNVELTNYRCYEFDIDLNEFKHIHPMTLEEKYNVIDANVNGIYWIITNKILFPKVIKTIKVTDY